MTTFRSCLRIAGIALCVLILPDDAFGALRPRIANGAYNGVYGDMFGMQNGLLGGLGQGSRMLQKVQTLYRLIDTLIYIREKKDVLAQETLKEIDENVTRQIQSLAKKDNVLGVAFAIGLGGADMQFESVPDPLTGLTLGGTALVCRGIADAMREPIKDAIGKIVGGPLDWAIEQVVELFHWIGKIIHGGCSSFQVNQLLGWQSLVAGSLDDIRQLLDKNGLASMRGIDKTLRDVDAGNDEKQTLMAWKILVLGYARQFDYCIMQIDQHVGYYNQQEPTVFYARELKQRLLEIEAILLQCSSLKALDASLDNNKMLIVAMQKNIDNLFKRLVGTIDQKQLQAMPANGNALSKSRDYLREMNGMGSRFSDDDAIHGLR
jgi:hypothetical protein